VGKQLEKFKAAVDKVVAGYNAEAVGPAKEVVLREYLLGTVMPTVVRTGVEGARRQTAKIRELKEELLSKANAVTSALTKSNEVRGQMSDKLASLKKGMQEQLSAADLDKRNTVAMYEAKLSEAKSKDAHVVEMQETLKSTIARLEADLKEARTAVGQSSTNEKEWLERERSWHADERRLREQASKATFELEALQREMDAAKTAVERNSVGRLQEVKDRHRVELDRVKRSHESAMVELETKLKSSSAGASTAETQSLRNQLQDAQSSVDTLNQHVDLLTETLGVTKDLLAAKTQEVGECEYQWAAAKAKLAQCESDKMEHEADVVHVLEPIVSQAKRLVSRRVSTCQASVVFFGFFGFFI
jgi:chromosome segregation ATPase